MKERSKLTDRVKILEVESLSPSVTTNISPSTLLILASKLHDLQEASLNRPVTLQSVRALLSHFGHPVRYNRETLERSLDGELLLYKRAFDPIVILSPNTFRGTNNYDVAKGKPTVLSDYIYLLQSQDTSNVNTLYIGLYTELNHTVEKHFVDNRLLRLEFKKNGHIETADLRQFGSRTVNDARRIGYHTQQGKIYRPR